MKENDDFRLNKSYDLLKNSVLDTSSVLMYQNGNSQILKDFGAAGTLSIWIILNFFMLILTKFL